MKKMMRKAPTKNSTKERLHVIPQTLNSHNRDPRRLNNHQNPPRNKETKGDVRDCLGEKCVYTHLAEGQHAYVHDYREKNPHICVKTQLGKGE